jgi:hypothetical protein
VAALFDLHVHVCAYICIPLSFFHVVLCSVLTDWLVFVFTALCMLLCFKIEVAQREFLEEGRPVFDLQLCIVLSFRRGSCHRKVSAWSLDADPVGSS